jgi:PAS domain S-box-containing protein
MADNGRSGDLVRENAELRERLAEAEGVLQAIRRGEIDAVVVSGTTGERVFTLEGADHPYRMLVESMNEGAATLTRDAVVLYANRKLTSLLGIPVTKAVGARLTDWVVQEDREGLADLVFRCEDDCASGEFKLLTRRGTQVPVYGSFSAYTIGDERMLSAVITDLSLAKHHAALQAAARQVREANERLREADVRKDEFLAVLAHELRNPLAPIRAAAQVIKIVNGHDDRINQARAMIERQVTHMARLVDDLMEVSRITLGRIDLQRHTESLATLLSSVAGSAESAMQAGRHTFTVELPDEPLLVDADITRLSQAVSNVLENAARYTPAGGRIGMKARREGDMAVIEVTDTGIGIAPEMLTRIFDMFVQGERFGLRGSAGLGIGLALTRRLIEMHGGTIEASSDGVGRGSRFTIRLPLSQEGLVKPQQRTPVAQVQPQRVLVVDDNLDAAESLRMLLELQGHSARAVHDGAGALDALREFPADVVLLDIGLPDVDGYHVARQMRSRFGANCPTLIALSGWGQEQDKERAAEAGLEAHFTKPIDPEALSRLLAKRARKGSRVT